MLVSCIMIIVKLVYRLHRQGCYGATWLDEASRKPVYTIPQRDERPTPTPTDSPCSIRRIPGFGFSLLQRHVASTPGACMHMIDSIIPAGRI